MLLQIPATAIHPPKHQDTNHKLSGKMEFQIPWLAIRIKEIFYHKKLSVLTDASQKTGIHLADSIQSFSSRAGNMLCFCLSMATEDHMECAVSAQPDESSLHLCKLIVLINVLVSYCLSLNF